MSLEFPSREESLQRENTFQALLAYFNHPELKIPCIHVTGSKGKGSIVTMIGNILKAAGFKTVGLFRSPALTDFTDRISETDGPFKQEVYENAFIELKSGLKEFDEPAPESFTKLFEKPDFKGKLTYFELVALFAFLAFRKAKCDFVVYEVFAGGRLDATNVIRPQVSVINTIELEHTNLFGNTLEKIATEKAGIIKPGVPVVIGPQDKESIKQVFLEKASEVEAGKIVFIAKKPQIDYFLDDENHLKMRLENLEPGLKVDLKFVGDFQAENALVATAAARLAMKNLRAQAIKTGLEKAFIPGRFEIKTNAELINFPRIPYLIIDGAHTKNSIKGAVETLEIYRRLLAKQKTYDSCLTDFVPDKKPLLFFACAEHKNVEKMAKILDGHFSKIILTKPGDFKAADLPRLEAAFHQKSIENYQVAIQTAFKTANQQGIGLAVLGSLYLAAEVKKYLRQINASPWG